ncbi:hypothetical protein CRM22_002556 [Opisthorchis felineus]|uniref:Cystatin domain-containing protein n=1 Tax=Opisthorchis felineus TaxID=147828 RepID=A0A4V3SGA5_OPIFE|nr:hypothetical protein CRM22_002556 [Opisthorchis felineus]TGZ71585.1 hypothetical protein CRM22_002556 [Opisthorchis felineus]
MLIEVLCLCLILCLPASSQVVAGAYTPFRCPNANEIQAFTSLLNAELSNYLGMEAVGSQEIQILEVSTQVVAGTNYRIKIRLANDQCYLVGVYQSLPSQEDGSVTLRIISLTPVTCPMVQSCIRYAN